MKRIFALLFCIALLAASLEVSVLAGNDLPFIPIVSNKCGADVKYKLNESDGLLTLEGSGDMYDYGDGSYAPWYGKRLNVKTVELDDGITSIGKSAFADCENLAFITVPNTVTQISEGAFDGCGEFVIRGYSGSSAEAYANANGIAFERITLYGDGNKDGQVNIRDITIMLQHIANWDVDIDITSADVNLDSDVNIRDVTLVLQKIAGWDVKLGE